LVDVVSIFIHHLTFSSVDHHIVCMNKYLMMNCEAYTHSALFKCKDM